MCQYNDPFHNHGGGDELGPNPFVWYGDTDGNHNGGICSPNPPGSGLAFTRPDVFNLAQCMELGDDTGVPTAGGGPSPACAACGILVPFGLPCYLDAACSLEPNGTSDLFINIFIPRNAQRISAVGNSDPGAFHYTVPSDAIKYLVPGTNGRPIGIGVYQLDDPRYDNGDVNTLMSDVAHEMVEEFTSPLATYFWTDPNAPEFGEQEAADICNGNLDPNPPGVGTGVLHWKSPTVAISDPAHQAQAASLVSYWSNFNGTCVTLDGVPPATVSQQSPHGGWNNSDVTVTLVATDAPAAPTSSGIEAILFQAGSDTPQFVIDPNSAVTPAGQGDVTFQTSFTVSREGITPVTFHAIDYYQNIESDETDAVMIDRTAPTISPAGISPQANCYSWYGAAMTPVTASFVCQDGLSGVKPGTCTTAVSLSGQGTGQTFQASALDNAGNQGSASAGPINIDLTPPTVTYSGNVGTYDASDTVNILCSATDALSGIGPANCDGSSSNTCATIAGPAYAFGVQTSSFSASATDRAGNQGIATTTFTVVVTTQGLAKLVMKFVDKAGIQSSLISKLNSIQSDISSGKTSAKANDIASFENELAAQTGKSISAGDAAILDYLLSFL